MEITQAPPRTELVRRATDLVPLLRSHAAWAEEHRRLHEESIEAMADAGIFKMRVPVRYGGYESDTRTLVEVASELARGDGAAAWIASVSWIPTWMAGLFPDSVQDEVFSTRNVRVCGTLSPSAMASPADGGIVVNGRWGFISGAWHSQWQEIIAMSPTPDGGIQPLMALVPLSDLQIIDDWYTTALQGSGSVSTVASDVFIPAERVLPLGAVLHEQYASVANAGSPMYRAPLLPTASASSVGTVLGLAKAAREGFLDRLPDRKITYTSYDSRREAPLTHLQVAEAALTIDEAEFHAFRLTSLVDDKAAAGQSWSLLERTQARADMGRVCDLARRATDTLADASGGSSIYANEPIQRIARDIRGINLHALMHPDTNYELYGRVLCGLEPNSFYL